MFMQKNAVGAASTWILSFFMLMTCQMIALCRSVDFHAGFASRACWLFPSKMGAADFQHPNAIAQLTNQSTNQC